MTMRGVVICESIVTSRYFLPPLSIPLGWLLSLPRLHPVIDAALVLEPLGTRPSATGNIFIERALEASGIPVLPIAADMVDARGWDGVAMRQKVGQFLAGLNSSAARDRV